MRRYTGHRGPDGDAVVVVEDEAGQRKRLKLRLDLMRHSPSGFNWGYAGSGPAQLALAILADHFEHMDGAESAAVHKRFLDTFAGQGLMLEALAVFLHQAFKVRAIAGLPSDAAWTMTSADVDAYVDVIAIDKAQKKEVRADG